MKELRNFTPARVGLGRCGNSLPTNDLLDFQLAHAKARDAVHFPLDVPSLQSEMRLNGWPAIAVHSAAADRTEYLRRPDLGRRLHPDSRASLEQLNIGIETVFVIADGLSALAVHTHAPALLREMSGELTFPVIIAQQGRVALADEIGELVRASLSVMLIGERPGLSSPDSLGIYLTWAPRPGRNDAERNCISNIREGGTSPGAAAALLRMLMDHSRQQKLSGVRLGGGRVFVTNSTIYP